MNGDVHHDAVVMQDGTRDLVVHPCAEVDDDRLARAVRGGGLDDLARFAARIAALAVDRPRP